MQDTGCMMKDKNDKSPLVLVSVISVQFISNSGGFVRRSPGLTLSQNCSPFPKEEIIMDS
jgi:hypothetical protein